MMVCLMTTIINMTTTFNQRDYKSLARAAKVCNERYDGRCLVTFQKRETNTYRALCGEKVEFDKKALLKYEMSVIMDELKDLSESEKKDALKKIGVKYE